MDLVETLKIHHSKIHKLVNENVLLKGIREICHILNYILILECSGSFISCLYVKLAFQSFNNFLPFLVFTLLVSCE
jgi:hypothetical protein